MTPAQFLSRLKRGDAPPVTLFLGPEAYERRRLREALIQAAVGEEREGALTRYDLSEVSLAEVIDDARAMSLFASRRLIIASSAEAALPRTRKAAEETEDDEGGDGSATSSADVLSAYLRDPAPDTILLFEATRWDFEGDDKKKTERVRKFYSAIPDVVELKRMDPGEARGLVDQLARAANLQLGPGAADLLTESLGADAGRIAVEIEKLSTFAGKGRAVTVEDISHLIPDARETTIFALVNALGRRDRGRALGVLDTLCRDGEYLPLALSFLSGQFRMALIAREANLRSAGQVQGHFSKSGIPMWGSRAEQVLQTATKFSKDQLERGMQLIFEADRDLRSPRPDDRIVMEKFIVELTAAQS